MTFTVVGRCPRTKMLGVAMATHAPAVGNRCPVVIPRMGATSVQAIADPRLTLLCTKLIGLGYHAGKIIQELESSDPNAPLRQIGVVDAWGNAAAMTGSANGAYAGHILGQGWLVMGNGVVGAQVIEAMAASMTATGDELLEERLMRALGLRAPIAAPDIVVQLLPVIAGNLVGGSVLVAGVYWVVYVRPGSRPSA